MCWRVLSIVRIIGPGHGGLKLGVSLASWERMRARGYHKHMGDSLVCWKCGASLEDVPLPIGRREECPACSADLHVCRMCEFYDTSVSRSCREPIADEVRDKERANFCGYFKAVPGAHEAGDRAAADEAKAKLAALFGEPDAAGDGDGKRPQSEAEAAKERLERLFGIDEKKDE